jgi:xanthine/CO dehydrogenase XdhC/CoxF family maturation factor
MKEINDILRAFWLAQREGLQAALATVVHVEGSSYRRPGARMLVTEKGSLTGAISGGCLEGDALRKALLAIHQQQNKLVTYDTSQEDDHRFGVQLGCNGIVHILFEPIDPARPNNPIKLLEELTRERRDGVLLTLFSMDVTRVQRGTCLLFAEGRLETDLPLDWQEMVKPDVMAAFTDRRSCFPQYTRHTRDGHENRENREDPEYRENREDQQEHAERGDLYGFAEFITPPPALVIAGAGNDVLPLVDIMSLLGWHITVVDGRAPYATADRFPKADRVLVAKPTQVLSEVNPDDQTLFILMTHNYQYDRALLRELLQRKFPYIGILGPRAKLDHMLEEIQDEGLNLREDQIGAIHGPVGLDIGAETAAEIAVAIVAEIKAFLSGRSGRPLRLKTDPIHSR